MKINKENTYLFLKGNKNKLVFNPPDDVITTDFTFMIRFTPDEKYYLEGMKSEAFFTQGLFSKNGKHIGLFFTAGRDEINNILLKVSFEWWKKTDNPEVDEVKSVDFYPSVEEVSKGLNVIVIKSKDNLELIVNGKTKTAEIKDVIDYSYSYTWVGCANRLSPEYQHIFEGDINLMHLQEKVLEPEKIDLFFNDYESFVKEVSQNMKLKTIFTSNFEEISPYKIKDHSYNNNHLIKFSKQWLN